MKNFAKIENDLVVDIIVAESYNDVSLLSGRYIESFDDESSRYNRAVIGSSYDSVKDAFINPKPYTEWLLNEETLKWEAPTEKPDGPHFWHNGNWEPIS